ncbi:amidase [Opitutia bacterium ISCC 51]|nr:amidase [Opitutae bacterium ISCC 51]QXD29972.1 amidase [Opitutae bacterium ISCC 52]
MSHSFSVTSFFLPSWIILFLSGCGEPGMEEPGPTASYNEFPLLEASIQELQSKMELGELSSQQITELYLDRILAIDKDGPKLNSVIEINPDALEIAAAMDEERAAGMVRGPMHGIPVMIKDNIDTADQMMTTAGATALIGNYAKEDAFLVKKLRESGAVLLGKTNLSEWANFRSFKSSSGWSSRGGQTKNPYVLDRNPCGSSSGSGAAVSANLCAVTIGTETNGSIVCPSNANGVVGIKPTVGLISRSGVIPISFSQDTAGPMARSVSDAALFMGALVGVDDRDSKSKESAGHSHDDYTQFLNEDGLRGKRIGVWTSKLSMHYGVEPAMESILKRMEEAGAVLVGLDEIVPDSGDMGGKSFLRMQYEFKDGLNKYLETASPSSGVKTLADIIAHNRENEAEAMPYFKMGILELSETRGDLQEDKYLDIRDSITDRTREGIDEAMSSHDLDAIFAPTGGPAWCSDPVNGDRGVGGSSSPCAWAGYPIITVPAASVHGLPLGVSFMGRAWSEGELIEIAYGFEQLTQARKAPEFLPTIQY